MFVLGLTGSIATGKSTVLEFFAQAGVPTYSADTAVHELYDGDAVAAIAAAFPDAAENGRIDRRKLSALLADNPARYTELEEIVHPLVRGKMLEFLDSARDQGADMAVIEVPLLFETGARYPVDAVAVTACPDEEQRRRALARPGMTVEKFDDLLARQMPQADKKERADFVIDTGTTLEATRQAVDTVVAECRARTGPARKSRPEGSA